jgi:uncharacterized membrane protein YgcG
MTEGKIMIENFKNKLSGVLVWIVLIAIILGPELSYALEDASLPAWLTNDYARITDMDYKAVVVDEPGSEGKIVVTERITFDVHAASKSNGFWELWRDLCEDTIDGVQIHYKVNSVKQIMPDGREIVWSKSPQLYWEDYDYVSSTLGPGKWYHSEGPYDEYRRQYECVFFYIDDVYREEMTFEIEYEMYNAVLRYGDCSDLYISMYSEDTIKYLESFSAEILIPNKDMPRVGNYTVTTYGTNAHSFPVEESATKNPGYYTFSFDLKEDDLKFKSYNQYIEFDLVSFGEDKHIFSEYASHNSYYNDNVLREIEEEQAAYAAELAERKATKLTVLGICALITTLILFFGRHEISKLNSKYPFYTSEQIIDTYRDVPSDLDPNFASALVFCKDKKPPKEEDGAAYSAILLSLARKQYIELKDDPITALDDVTIYINEDDAIGMIETTPVAVHNDTDSYDRATEQPDCDLSSFYSDSPTSYGSFQPHSLVTEPEANPCAQTTIEDSLDAFAFFEPHEPLTICEKYYLDLIKRHAVDGKISMDQLQKRVESDYAYMQSFTNNMKNSIVNCGVGLGYFQKANYLEPKKRINDKAVLFFVLGIAAIVINIITSFTQIDSAFGGFLLVSAASIVNGFYLRSQAHRYVLLTEYGEEEYKKWRGLYNFLKSDTLMNERTVVELPLWEKYLVYATAFGISEKVIAAIKIRCPAMVTETGGKSIIYNSYCRSGRIRSTGRRFHSSVRRGSSGGFSGSGGGGGFGYGGGGRGGGGGGGGH